MALKIFSRLQKFNLNAVRAFSLMPNDQTTSKDLVLIDVDEKSGFATLSLNRPPVNSLNKELFVAISDALTQMERNKSRGVIMSSVSLKGVKKIRILNMITFLYRRHRQSSVPV
jgi:hypothetical protein